MAEAPLAALGQDRPLVLVSNRGPVSFVVPDGGGEPVAGRGAGGLVSALGPLLRDTGVTWVAAAMSAGDEVVARRGVTEAEGYRIRLLAFEPDTWSGHYDEVCNEALWFVHHGLWDPVYEPSWSSQWMDGPWAAHRRVNRAFAEAVAEDAPPGAVVLIQDYHLCMTAPVLRRTRPDLTLVHFSHTPFAPPDWLRMLPAGARAELIEGLGAHHRCGFHTRRWAEDFEASCRAQGVVPPAVFVAPLGPDIGDLERTAASQEFATALSELDRMVGDRDFVVRVDRIELSKNLLRGFLAFESMLENQPERHGRVVFGAYCYPSRLGVDAYDRYHRSVLEVVERVNRRFGNPDWQPIHYDPVDDYPRSMAALARADVVVVNPIRDGLNLVAKEAALLNGRHAQLVLSPEAGAWEELSALAWRSDPFDVDQTAGAIAEALDVAGDERVRRAETWRTAAAHRTPEAWLADQVVAAGDGRAGPGRS